MGRTTDDARGGWSPGSDLWCRHYATDSGRADIAAGPILYLYQAISGNLRGGDVMVQTKPSADELTELRGSVLQKVDTNRDGKIELGEFARYANEHDYCLFTVMAAQDKHDKNSEKQQQQQQQQ